MPDSGTFRILVAVETDATRYYGADASRPALLGATDAEQMLAHLAADLQALLPGISDCSLVAAGALFDQTQILRPGYPAFAALELAAKQSGADSSRPGLVSIAARDGAMPVSDLQPLDDIPLGLLQLLPVVIQGPSKLMETLTEAMEYRFLEEGQLSAHSAAWLQSAFDVSIQHARLMTLTDLSTLLRMQLDHFGFLSLWELLDAALSDPDKAMTVTSAGGHPWEWKEGAAHTVFETFDYWAGEGGGARLPGSRLALAAGYADWTREFRQYLTTLAAHSVDVRLYLPGDDSPLAGSYFRECSETAADSHACAVTEHQFDDLGAIAITLVQDGLVENFYPVRPQGLNEVHALLRDRIPGGHAVAFPGTILYDETTRRLKPDADCEPGPP
jgi:hypothetical protein